ERLQVLGLDDPRPRAGLQDLRLRPQQGRNRALELQEELGLRAAHAVVRVSALQARRRAAEQSSQPEVRGVHRDLEAIAAAGREPARAADRAASRLMSAAASARREADAPGERRDPSKRGDAGDERPLVMHVVYSFGVGGLENGVVNLIN